MIGLAVLLGFLVIVEVLGLPVLVVLYLGERSRMTARLDALARRIAALESPQAPTSEPISAARVDSPPATMPAAAPAEPAAVVEAAPAVEPAPVAPPPLPPVAPVMPAAARESLEERVMRRWAVWLGGVALALGAVFLVKYSIEQGWFGPAARVSAGVLLGLVLWGLGEWARQRDERLPLPGEVPPDLVPPALAAAGSVALFASLYAAHGLYDLLGPLTAFVLLAAVGVLTVAQSLLHGVFMAWLGIAGIYIVPALVTTPHPSIAGLLGYIGIATAGSTALLRWRAWPWLGALALIGAVFWAIATMVAGTEAELLWPLGLYLLALPLLFLLVTDAVSEAPLGLRTVTGWLAAGLSVLLMWILVEIEQYDTTALIFAAVLTAIYAALAWRHASFDRLVWIGALLESAVIAGWEFGRGTWSPDERLHLLMVPPSGDVGSYVTVAAITGAAFGLGGFALLWRALHPERWAIASAATPLLILMAVYWRLEHFAVSLPWAGLALGLAVLALLAVERLAPSAEQPGPRLALAAYAVAMTAAVSLGITMSLRLGWLTVALALELPALGWLNRRIPTRAYRVIAGIVAAAVLVRLLLNPNIADYGFDPRPILNGLLYLYGVPVAAFAGAAWLLRREKVDVAVLLLEGGALALALALIALEIRHFVHGGVLTGGRYELIEQGLQSTAWLSVAYVLQRWAFGIEPVIREYAWRIIAAAAALHVLLISVLISNPLLQPIGVGEWPVFNALLFAYAVPAILALLFANALGGSNLDGFALPAAVAGLALFFLYLTLETRHWFQGPVLANGAPDIAEWYAYSLVWLAYGAVLLGLGMALGQQKLRLAGLAIGALVAVKVFVFDMAALSGLYRAASFLGLGASLVGFAYLYQRLIARARRAGGT